MKYENMKHEVRHMICLLVFAAAYILLSVLPVLAINTPTTGSFAYDVYDIAVNSILKGPVGFVAGVSAIALGAVAAIRSQVMAAIPAVLGGAALLKADAIVSSLGAIF